MTVQKIAIFIKKCDNVLVKTMVIFGGTFDPVHIEHVNMVKAVLNEMHADKVIVVPTFLPPHKHVSPASGADRLKMLEIAFRGLNNVEISDFEIKAQGTSYFYITAEHFRKIYPEDRLYLLIGGDMLKDFKTWKYPERILAAVDLAVIKREDRFTDHIKEAEYIFDRFHKRVTFLDYIGKTVSSTEIRTYLAFGLPVSGVDKKVCEYIAENGVYKPDKYQKYILQKLPIKRVIHTADVVVCALKKAKEESLDNEKVRIAATLHDCAKYEKAEDFKDCALPSDLPPPVVHAFLGAYIAEKVLDVTDAEILDAIRYHTSGKPAMSTLAKLIFTADMVEKGRTYDGVEVLREAYEKDLNDGFKLCLKEEMIHLLNKRERIYKATLDAYDYYITRDKDGKDIN